MDRLNTLRPRQNVRHFTDDMFKCIFLNENVWIPIEISLKFVPEGSINNNPALFQIVAWRRPGDKPSSKPTMVSSLTHICIPRPQWVNAKEMVTPHLPPSRSPYTTNTSTQFWTMTVTRKMLPFDDVIMNKIALIMRCGCATSWCLKVVNNLSIVYC